MVQDRDPAVPHGPPVCGLFASIEETSQISGSVQEWPKP